MSMSVIYPAELALDTNDSIFYSARITQLIVDGAELQFTVPGHDFETGDDVTVTSAVYNDSGTVTSVNGDLVNIDVDLSASFADGATFPTPVGEVWLMTKNSDTSNLKHSIITCAPAAVQIAMAASGDVATVYGKIAPDAPWEALHAAYSFDVDGAAVVLFPDPTYMVKVVGDNSGGTVRAWFASSGLQRG